MITDLRVECQSPVFVGETAFTLPASVTRLCRAAVLIIGDIRLSEPPPGPSIISCVQAQIRALLDEHIRPTQ